MAIDKPILEQGWRAPIMGVLRAFGFLGLSFVTFPSLLISYYRAGEKSHKVSISFYRCLSRILAIKVRAHGEPTTQKPTLFVSNHSSYLDVPVLGSIIPATFVAKSDVENWPFIGFLSRLHHTAFIERRASDLTNQSNGLRKRLVEKESLILFPEGTSSDGTRTLPFKSSLFNIVEQPLPDGTAITVQPITTLCTELGGLPIGRIWRPYYAWYGDMTFMRHLWNAFCIGHFTVDVIFHPPVSAADFRNRKVLADYCQKQVAKGVELCVTGRVNPPAIAPHSKKQLAPPTPDLAQTGA